MSYWQHAPSGVHQRLIELAELYAGCRAIYFDLVDQHHWRPSPGSAAADDQATLPPAEKQPDGTSLSAGYARLIDVIASYLQIAAGHMGGLAALHAAEEVMFSPGMLVRGVIENCAHVFWVIGPGGEEPVSAKLARAYLEEDLSAEEAKKNSGRMSGKGSATYQGNARARKELRQEIFARFPTASAEHLGQRQLAGQSFPNPEKCVEAMYEFLAGRTSSSVDARIGIGVYGYLSNVTHPTLYPVRELREWHLAASGHDEHATAISVLPIDFVERQASVTAVCFFNTLSYLTGYCGWPKDHHNRLVSLLRSALPNSIVD